MDRSTVSQALWLEVPASESKINPGDAQAFDLILNRALAEASRHYAYQATATLTTVVGTDIYAVESLSPVMFLPFQIENADRRILRQRHGRHEFVERSASSGTPGEWQFLGESIVLFPKPDAVEALTVTGFAMHPTVSEASPDILIPAAHQQAIVDYCEYLVRQWPDMESRQYAENRALAKLAAIRRRAISLHFLNQTALPPSYTVTPLS